ncbi:putative zinc-binding metallopeptidase [Marinobacter sp. 2_MG-2023]|uniref:zinc-binding metallopeptidase family protein n=1 Tax=Marinobacter sp. 2_MG-2023 TaxID=3062679 RepID=UPI0026E4941E|nr:putative zinc-binding peptidase [Marinobacter sp. 2_MG-2023]MDO6441651.1 putative zinc-binding peptidase [Marinobacter sp. 2_MG-2023]
MKMFHCGQCASLLYFENSCCTSCGTSLGFAPDVMDLLAINSKDADTWEDVSNGNQYKLCGNYRNQGACNWLLPVSDTHTFCIACRLNRTIPDLSVARNHDLWVRLEREKRRLVYSLLRLGLPCEPRQEDQYGLAFDFLADQPAMFDERAKVITGHSHGVITLNIAEADPVERERMRSQMAEPYRTVLGHFRHESGHYYWDHLVRPGPWLGRVREVFGDDTRDYKLALDQHYQCGPPANWQNSYISAYASSHPWEDWAETWAHYLHMVDTLETAWQLGLRVNAKRGSEMNSGPGEAFDPYRTDDFDGLVKLWLPLTLALNSLNRSMGHEHAYPFVLADPVVEKLRLVHRIVNSG